MESYTTRVGVLSEKYCLLRRRKLTVNNMLAGLFLTSKLKIEVMNHAIMSLETIKPKTTHFLYIKIILNNQGVSYHITFDTLLVTIYGLRL